MLTTTPSASGLIGHLEQLTAPTHWISGEIGDWQWSIVNMGMSWGICKTLDEAHTALQAEITLLESDFDFTPAIESESEFDLTNCEF